MAFKIGRFTCLLLVTLINRTVQSTFTTTTTAIDITPSEHSNLSNSEPAQAIHFSQSALCIFLSFFCFITVFGNALVIYAIIQERYLKSGMYPDDLNTRLRAFFCIIETVRDHFRLFP